MGEYKVRYNNSKFSDQRIEIDGKSYNNCEFENCIIIVEKGETDLGGFRFKDCKLMLRGNAYTVGGDNKALYRQKPIDSIGF